MDVFGANRGTLVSEVHLMTTPTLDTQVSTRQTGLFDEIRQRVLRDNTLGEYERRSALWFQTLFGEEIVRKSRGRLDSSIQNVGRRIQTKQVMSPRQVDVGQLYFFAYDAKHRQTLPFFDRFPFVVVIDKTPTGFLGINFHYLPYRDRAILFDALYTNRFAVTYKTLLTSTKYFGYAACLHRYLYEYCTSQLLMVGETDWDLALFLPVSLFHNARPQQVWAWSERKNFRQSQGQKI